MGIFTRKPQPQAAQTPASEPTQVAPTAGKISLVKGQKISLVKPGSGGSTTITVSNGWTANGKDYDLKALVLLKDGRQIYVGAANSDEVISAVNGAVRHSGDSRAPGVLESLSIHWDPEIARIAVSSYSALENGTGSFREYGVYVEIVNGSQVIRIDAASTSADGRSYTLCFGEIIMEPDGTMSVVAHELYSKRNSENRVGYARGQVAMDIGPRGQNK